jgi:hypothetical protein
MLRTLIRVVLRGERNTHLSMAFFISDKRMIFVSRMEAFRPCDAIESRAPLRLSHRARCVNTSLSGTLFFLMRWCNPNAVHFDSRVHDSDTAISL